MTLQIYDSLSKEKRDFKPLNPGVVTMYTCGPTVYDYVTIGNWRTYTNADFIYRVLTKNGYKINYIMNITDVGHLTGDNLGDADIGEDRLEAAAEKEGKSAREIANFYTRDFLKGFDKLNLSHPAKFTKATEYISQMIDLIKTLEQKGFAYKTSDGVYFDTSKYEDYGKLSGFTEENIQEGARVEPNPEKKNSTDFALWLFSPKDQMRWQEWDSPWGKGWPGWHIECSAMVLSELGKTIDIHIGGEDLKMIHHQNEIAQSECSTGSKFVQTWMHCAFLQVDGGRMGKSLGNAYTISDIEAKGFSPLSLRYFYTTAHYRKKLNFTWESLSSAQNALEKLYDLVESYQEDRQASVSANFMSSFTDAFNDDINIPQAVSVMWEMLKSEIGEGEKLATLLKMDEVLGLAIEDHIGFQIPNKISDLAKVRWEYRKQGIWDKADVIRRQIEEEGFVVEDGPGGYKIKRKI